MVPRRPLQPAMGRARGAEPKHCNERHGGPAAEKDRGRPGLRPLRDVPIEEQSENFDTVVLVDLVHLASVRLWLRLKGYSNVRLIERDLSGYDELAAGRQPEPLAFLRTVPYLDFVVSANLLSQIGRGAKRR